MVIYTAGKEEGLWKHQFTHLVVDEMHKANSDGQKVHMPFTFATVISLELKFVCGFSLTECVSNKSLFANECINT